MKIAYVDMDGVVADFMGRYLQYTGCNVDFPKGEYDLRKIFGEYYIDPNDLPHRFWEHLDLTPEAKPLIESIRKRDYQPMFVSSVFKSFGVLFGKNRWILSNFFSIPFMPIKHHNKGEILPIRPDDVLVDDSDNVIQSYVDRGGRAILIPRPWNHGSGDYDLSIL